MGDDQGGDGVQGEKPQEHFPEQPACLGVQAAEWLVQEYRIRQARKTPGKRSALLHAPGKLIRSLLLLPRETCLCKEVARETCRAFPFKSLIEEGKRGVLRDGPPGKEPVVLKHKADPRRTGDTALGRLQQDGGDFQECCLSYPGIPRDNGDFPGPISRFTPWKISLFFR